MSPLETSLCSPVEAPKPFWKLFCVESSERAQHSTGVMGARHISLHAAVWLLAGRIHDNDNAVGPNGPVCTAA
jgi:hypothetical protein